jgi:hypothetical protein
MTLTKTYPAVNLNSPVVIFWILISVLISSFGIWMLIVAPSVIYKLIFGLFALFLPLILIYSLTSKIIFKDNQIEKKSIFGNRILRIDSVKSFGVYAQSGRVGIKIDRNDISKRHFTSQLFIYISENPDYDPNSLNQKKSIRFHYRKNLFEDLERLLI